ncbi:MAG: transporter suffix domain-containing protein [Myxococcota bacterium]
MRRRRLIAGWVLFGLSLLPWAVAPVVPFLGMPATRTMAAIGALVVGAEVVGALAVLVLGREAYAAFRRHWLRRRPGSHSCTN